MSKPTTPPDNARPIALREALEERYLAYALSTITQRALPDVRDGLKPVQRRLLFAMRQLKLDPSGGFKKCARVVGEVIGRYHPHGDQSIYDALVRLAQDFAQRYPMVEGQGNFGNIDGDNAAAMRYTESRMTEVARLMLDGLDEDTVDFRDTYDGEDEEPVVLPGAFPNLLANGTTGIAVGMATSIPPHNAAELVDAALHLIKQPNARDDTLLKYVPGPDFPTGGVLIEPAESIAEAYRTGRGSFRLRARWESEDTGRGGYQVVVTQMPYQVQKARLIERVADLLQAKKLPLLADIRDESAEDVRLVLEPRSRTIEPEVLMESLFRTTDLEVRIPLNMNVLTAGQVPQVLSLRQVLQAFLDHRQVVLRRRTQFRLGKIAHRLEVLEGYLAAYLNLDEVIRIIREEDEPKKELIAAFKLSEVQAEAILNMRLRSLRKLEEMEIKGEHKALTAEAKTLNALMKSDDKQWAHISDELKEVRSAFGSKTDIGRRRTLLADAPEVDEAAVVEELTVKEPITVVCSEGGWIRSLKGHADDTSALKFKTGDAPRFAVHAQSTDKIVLFATNGRFYTLDAAKLPGGRGFGEPVSVMVDLGDGESIVSLFVHTPGRSLLVASQTGYGFVVPEDDVIAMTRKGKQVLNLAAGDEAHTCVEATGDTVAVMGENRKLLLFPLEQVSTMSRGRGVRLQRYKDGGLRQAKVFALKDGFRWRDGGGQKQMDAKTLKDWRGDRAQAGRLPPPGFPKRDWIILDGSVLARD
ncbi:DNA topoisomerase IV subunit A [Pyruvatibacter sp.]|uniref:DNA topoisomerase IV subunit A n=1 Tax=Pyruvatibacter sp. TaxID=1981328 RepID=UPI0032EAB823